MQFIQWNFASLQFIVLKVELHSKVYIRHFSNLIKSVLKVNQESRRKHSFEIIYFVCLFRVVGVKNEFVCKCLYTHMEVE